MKRLLLISLGVVILGASALYFFSDDLAAAAARAAIRRVEKLAASRGVEITSASFARAQFTSLDTLSCDRVRAVVRLQRGLVTAGPEWLAAGVDRVVVEATSFSRGLLVVSVSGGVVEVLDENAQPRGDRISQVRARIQTDFNWKDPVSSARKLEKEARRLLQEGRCSLAARLDGVVRFRIGARWEEVAMHARPQNGETVLTLDEADVERVSKDYVEPLTKTEIELVATNPVRAPALLRLSEQASAAALALRRRDATFPQDAYRHVFWSYLLTREFGPAFAEEVTNAHEADPTYEQGAANQRMDLVNNAVGRTFALADVPESELAERVRRDPRVVRSPR